MSLLNYENSPQSSIYYWLYKRGRETWNRWAVSARAFKSDETVLNKWYEEKKDQEAAAQTRLSEIIGGAAYIERARELEAHVEIPVPFSENEISQLSNELRKEYEGWCELNGYEIKLIKDINCNTPISFRETIWNEELDFESFIFPSCIEFDKNIFRKEVNFKKAFFHEQHFHTSCKFTHCLFEEDTNFSYSAFKKMCIFTGSVFNQKTSFSASIFHDKAFFQNTIFSNDGDFHHSFFRDFSDFTEADFNEAARFYNCSFKGYVKFDMCSFSSLSLSHTNFSDNVSFKDTIFKTVPNFAGIKTTGIYNFVGCKWPNKISDDATSDQISYSQLKREMNRLHMSELEMFFFQRELMCRFYQAWRHLNFNPTSWVYMKDFAVIGIYQLVSACGTSFIRPLIWLIIFTFISVLFYKYVALENFKFTTILYNISLPNSFPYLMDTSEEFINKAYDEKMALSLKAVFLAHKVTASILLFSIALGIRNQLRIK